MADSCCSTVAYDAVEMSPRYRKTLWLALVINTLMFTIEITCAFKAGSVALLADAADFLGDAGNYALALVVLPLGLIWRARTAFLKGLTMGMFGLFVLGKAALNMASGTPPEPLAMGAVALLALMANLGVTLMLYAFRTGDANMRSVWLCSRNDAIGNLAVILAALGVFGTGQAWPDLIVAGLMGSLGLTAAGSVMRQAQLEIGVVRATNSKDQRTGLRH